MQSKSGGRKKIVTRRSLFNQGSKTKRETERIVTQDKSGSLVVTMQPPIPMPVIPESHFTIHQLEVRNLPSLV